MRGRRISCTNSSAEKRKDFSLAEKNHSQTGRGIYHTADVVARHATEWLGRRPLLLICDFDGTLSHLAPTPNEAVMLPQVHAALAAVKRHPRITLAIVSGRRIEDVRERSGNLAPFVGGLHGLEIDGPDGHFRHPSLERVAAVIRDIRARAAEMLAWCPAVVLENKTYALTCHVRRVPADDAGRALGQFVESAQAALDSDVLRLLPGAQAVELLPAVEWHKGKAVEWIRSVVDTGPGAGAGVMYIGDDRTDEDAFAAIQSKGLAVGVGDRPREHLIRFRLAGPASVGRLLELLSTSDFTQRADNPA